ncbi:MAG: winged helix-turn-helix domain-containing protein [Methanolobus sp.]|uniref:helix-turn-helix transcriptional regulator n=1 Tax=Methanolobus sp. TaxID=1874737 RepID=UPI002731664D|nr:winged helix-turn-helix domain-containing protein [Methanolobus sp.]MDP2217414.1 winged helix-turn-helix domain-containing protein [Methanolobus sp.]
MKKPLIDVLFKSEKRKGILLLLQDEAKEMPTLMKLLDSTRQALLPQIKILEEHYLVSHDKDTYKLTTIGKIIVDKMIPLSNTVDFFDIDIDYWGTHKPDFIPSHLFKRISELRMCKILTPSLADTYSVHDRFYEMSKHSTFQFEITATFYPYFPKLFYELIPHNINIHIVMTTDLFEKLQAENREEVAKLIDSKLIHFYVYPEKMELLSFLYNEHCIMLSPLTNNGEFDNKHIECCNPSALKWGKELFEYYLEKSILITEI